MQISTVDYNLRGVLSEEARNSGNRAPVFIHDVAFCNDKPFHYTAHCHRTKPP